MNFNFFGVAKPQAVAARGLAVAKTLPIQNRRTVVVVNVVALMGTDAEALGEFVQIAGFGLGVEVDRHQRDAVNLLLHAARDVVGEFVDVQWAAEFLLQELHFLLRKWLQAFDDFVLLALVDRTG